MVKRRYRRKRKTGKKKSNRAHNQRKRFFNNLYRTVPEAWDENPPGSNRWHKLPSHRGSFVSRSVYGDNAYSADPSQLINRIDHQYSGEGDYKDWLRRGSKTIGGIAGAGLGFMQGGLAGAEAGAKSGFSKGGKFSKYMGWGDYVSTNQIIGGSTASDPQADIQVNPMNQSGDVFISHSEFLGNVVVNIPAGATASSFETNKIIINPALSESFPFLSQIAQNYVLYDFQGLIFHYKPTSGEGSNANDNAVGKVILATQYDQDAPDFSSSIQMENYDYSNSFKPSVGGHHGVETAPGGSVIDLLYTRAGATTKAKQFTDLGNFFVATEGVPGAAGTQVQVGEIWVAYKIRLSRANLFTALNKDVSTNIWRFRPTAASFINDVVSNTENMMSDVTLTSGSTASTDMLLTFPREYAGKFFRLVVHLDQDAAGTQRMDSLNGTSGGGGGPVNCVSRQPDNGTVLLTPWLWSTAAASDVFKTCICYIKINNNITGNAEFGIRITAVVNNATADACVVILEESNELYE